MLCDGLDGPRRSVHRIDLGRPERQPPEPMARRDLMAGNDLMEGCDPMEAPTPCVLATHGTPDPSKPRPMRTLPATVTVGTLRAQPTVSVPFFRVRFHARRIECPACADASPGR